MGLRFCLRCSKGLGPIKMYIRAVLRIPVLSIMGLRVRVGLDTINVISSLNSHRVQDIAQL